MSLRTKLLALFFGLAVVPLIAVGAYGYAQSLRALGALLERQTAAVVDDAATAVSREITRKEPFLLLLAENAETQRLYRARDSSDADSAYANANAFLSEARQASGDASIELSDTAGNVLYPAGQRASDVGLLQSVALEQDVRDPDSGVRRGRVVLEMPIDALLPRDLLDRHIGDHGYSIVIDRRAKRVLSHPSPALIGQPFGRLLAQAPWADTTKVGSPRGTFHYGSGDSARVVSYASLQVPPWTILSVASVAEFSPPFERARALQLVIVLALTAVTTVAFVQMLRRTTRSLEELTLAAESVGRGDLDPPLPRVRRDEVGRLTLTFETMVRRVREMIGQVESSRQMAVIGEFASQIAHEIRNPLTSIKLNLQGLARDARSGTLPLPDAAAVDICLVEIDRLDGVVSSVLTLAQSAPTILTPCAAHAIVRDALRVVAVQAAGHGVAIEADLRAECDTVLADNARLHRALLNLFLNALAAMPNGGRLHVSSASSQTAAGRTLEVRVRDTGPGVPSDQRDRIFRPFHTTRPDGTGLGLPIARRTAEALGGRLTLSEDATDGPGAEFLLELPIAVDRTGAPTPPESVT